MIIQDAHTLSLHFFGSQLITNLLSCSLKSNASMLCRIKEHELLGEGAFGQVYKATIRGSLNAKKQTVAMKKLKGRQQRHVFVFKKIICNNTCFLEVLGSEVGVIYDYNLSINKFTDYQ